MLPGELEGTVNPEDFGFDVIKDEELTGSEAADEMRKFYEGAKERSGVADPLVEQRIGELATQSSGRNEADRPTSRRRRGYRLRLREVR